MVTLSASAAPGKSESYFRSGAIDPAVGGAETKSVNEREETRFVIDQNAGRSQPGDRKLTVLITNVTLAGRTGTEVLTRDLALGLLRLGHRPIVYTQGLGPIAEELRRASVPVTTSIDSISTHVDIIHAHHTPVAAVAVTRFPDVPAIFVAHSFLWWHDTPPLFPSIRRYVAVDTTVVGRLMAEEGLPPTAVGVLLNAVDMGRFKPGPALPARPRRALAFAKNLGHVEAIKQACALRGIPLETIGHAVGRIVDAPELLLPQNDLIFTSALSALEAMACGRAVIVCDGRGLAGFVTPERFDQWRAMNFGLRTLTRQVTAEALLAEIDSYDAGAATVVGWRARTEAGLDRWICRLVSLYFDVIAEHPAAVELQGSTAMAAARHLERWSPRFDTSWPWMIERQALITDVTRLRQERDEGSAAVEGMRQDLVRLREERDEVLCVVGAAQKNAEVMGRELVRLRQERDEALGAFEALRASRSWRMTEPFRRVSTIMRRLR
jgi:hypothetical protein